MQLSQPWCSTLAWLFRAVDKQGTVDFLLTHRRNAKAARRFLAKALRTRQHWPPHLINTDKTLKD